MCKTDRYLDETAPGESVAQSKLSIRFEWPSRDSAMRRSPAHCLVGSAERVIAALLRQKGGRLLLHIASYLPIGQPQAATSIRLTLDSHKKTQRHTTFHRPFRCHDLDATVKLPPGFPDMASPSIFPRAQPLSFLLITGQMADFGKASLLGIEMLYRTTTQTEIAIESFIHICEPRRAPLHGRTEQRLAPFRRVEQGYAARGTRLSDQPHRHVRPGSKEQP